MDQYANYLYAINERPQKQQGTLKSSPLLGRASLFTASFQSCFSMMNNNKNHRTVIPRQISQYGTIPILRQHILKLFLTPPTHYVSISIVMSIFKNGHFTNSPTLSFCWRNIGMVPIWPASKKSPCNPEFLMKLDAHSGSSLCIFLFGENIYQAIFTLFFQIFWFLVACNFPIKCIFNNTLRI